jgi:hypothetical protein
MMQIKNEVGLLRNLRERFEAANEALSEAVVRELSFRQLHLPTKSA